MGQGDLRDYESRDAAELSRVALAAFAEFAGRYADWPAMAAGVAAMPRLAETGELIVAEHEGRLVGGVAYVPAGKPKAAFFDPAWPTIRMLVVHPGARGRGLGRSLAEECVRRARRDGAPAIALHTSPVMEVALPLYLRMGFKFLSEAPPIHGVPYSVYLRRLGSRCGGRRPPSVEPGCGIGTIAPRQPDHPPIDRTPQVEGTSLTSAGRRS